MTPKQKHHQRQRLHQQARNAAKEAERTKQRKLNDERRERRKRANRGLLTTQPAYHEKMRKETEARGKAYKQAEIVRLENRRQRQRRKVAVFSAMLKEAA